MGLLDILNQYAGAARPQADTNSHFDEVARQTSPGDLGSAISAMVRSDATICRSASLFRQVERPRRHDLVGRLDRVHVTLHRMKDLRQVCKLAVWSRGAAIDEVGVERILPGEPVGRRLGTEVFDVHGSRAGKDRTAEKVTKCVRSVPQARTGSSAGRAE